MSKFNIGIVGATGSVGEELLSILEHSKIEVNNLKLFASERSNGTKVRFRGNEIIREPLNKDSAKGLDYMFFCTEASISQQFIPIFSKLGTICIDNSSAYRLSINVPLVIPEINSKTLKKHDNVIANPNCSTIIALMALYPLHKQFTLNGFCVSTYQAVSGTGKNGIMALENDLKGEHELSIETFGCQIAYNVIPRIGQIDTKGYSLEENKMQDESRKILEIEELKISAMCVRVPVLRAHSMSMFASFKKPFDLNIAIEILKHNRCIDFYENETFPCALQYSNKDKCGIGRLRKDEFLDNGSSFWVVGDQIRKGAALNAFQIMLAMESL